MTGLTAGRSRLGGGRRQLFDVTAVAAAAAVVQEGRLGGSGLPEPEGQRAARRLRRVTSTTPVATYSSILDLSAAATAAAAVAVCLARYSRLQHNRLSSHWSVVYRCRADCLSDPLPFTGQMLPPYQPLQSPRPFSSLLSAIVPTLCPRQRLNIDKKVNGCCCKCNGGKWAYYSKQAADLDD